MGVCWSACKSLLLLVISVTVPSILLTLLLMWQPGRKDCENLHHKSQKFTSQKTSLSCSNLFKRDWLNKTTRQLISAVCQLPCNALYSIGVMVSKPMGATSQYL